MITEGMTPAEYVAELNNLFSSVPDADTLTVNSEFSVISANYELAKVVNPLVQSIGVGLKNSPSIENTNINRLVTDTWFNNSWLYRSAIVLDGSTLSGNVENSPVRVHIDRTKFDYSKIKTTGEDIRFAFADKILLNYEIEYWIDTSGSEDAVCWVSIPNIQNTSGNYLYMYFGNADAVDSQNVHAVWDAAGAIGVWHFADGGGTDVKDSSSSNIIGTISDTTYGSFVNDAGKSTYEMTMPADQYPGAGRGAGVDCGNPTIITENDSDISTLSWFYAKSVDENTSHILCTSFQKVARDWNFDLAISPSDERVFLMMTDGVMGILADNYILTEWGASWEALNNWHSFVHLLKGNFMYTYRDGDDSLNNSDPNPQPFNINGGVRQKSNKLYIGMYSPLVGFFVGLLDELRVYNKALTLDEAKLDNMNRLNTLISVLPIQTF